MQDFSLCRVSRLYPSLPPTLLRQGNVAGGISLGGLKRFVYSEGSIGRGQAPEPASATPEGKPAVKEETDKPVPKKRPRGKLATTAEPEEKPSDKKPLEASGAPASSSGRKAAPASRAASDGDATEEESEAEEEDGCETIGCSYDPELWGAPAVVPPKVLPTTLNVLEVSQREDQARAKHVWEAETRDGCCWCRCLLLVPRVDDVGAVWRPSR